MAIVIAIGLFGLLALLHALTQGRSSPIAALAFMLGGPVLGVILLIPAAIVEAESTSHLSSYEITGRVFGMEYGEYALAMLVVGLGVAALAAAVYMVSFDDQVSFGRERRSAAPRPVASAALAALGLDSSATPEDVEHAYRVKAFELRAERGEDGAALARLESTYKRAKKHVLRGELEPSLLLGHDRH